MAKQKKVIVTAAITGAIHTPSMSPYLPKGIEEISDNAIGAFEAGASMVHIHARKDGTGEPTSDLDYIGEILSSIKKRTKGIIAITTGGALGMSVEERLAVIPRFKPEMASCNSGSINFVLKDLVKTIPNPQFDWEVPFLERTYGNIFKNTYSDMEYCINIMNECGTRPEFEIFDLGQINNVAYFLKRGIVKKPIYLQFVMGVQGGIPITIDNVMILIRAARELLGDDVQYSMVAGGRRLYRYEACMAVLGGNVRVGLEDSLYLTAGGELAKSNAEQVDKICTILKLLDFEIASSDEAREMLALKGGDNVDF